jgi:hypothetical protein
MNPNATILFKSSDTDSSGNKANLTIFSDETIEMTIDSNKNTEDAKKVAFTCMKREDWTIWKLLKTFLYDQRNKETINELTAKDIGMMIGILISDDDETSISDQIEKFVN